MLYDYKELLTSHQKETPFSFPLPAFNTPKINVWTAVMKEQKERNAGSKFLNFQCSLWLIFDFMINIMFHN